MSANDTLEHKLNFIKNMSKWNIQLPIDWWDYGELSGNIVTMIDLRKKYQKTIDDFLIKNNINEIKLKSNRGYRYNVV